jgi:hypothetical protein
MALTLGLSRLRLTEAKLKLRKPLFEAAFSAEGGYCRVDILRPAPLEPL